MTTEPQNYVADRTRFSDEIRSIRFGKPTLEDVFIKLTGRELAPLAAISR